MLINNSTESQYKHSNPGKSRISIEQGNTAIRRLVMRQEKAWTPYYVISPKLKEHICSAKLYSERSSARCQ